MASRRGKRCSERRPEQTGEISGLWTEVRSRRRFSLIETVISTGHVKDEAINSTKIPARIRTELYENLH